MSKLTPKQKRFCEEWIIDCNGSRAAIAAGYSEDSAPVIASENLKKPNVAAYINELQKEVSAIAGITRVRVAKEYAAIAFSNIADMVDEDGSLLSIDDLTDEQRKAIASIKVDKKTMGDTEIGIERKEVKLHDKLAALREIKKMFGYDEQPDSGVQIDITQITGMIVK